MPKYLVKQDIQLQEYLLKHYPKKSVKNLLKFKCVCVNGKTVSQFDYQLKVNDTVVVEKGSNQHNLDIIYEDKDLIVINKPAGLLSIATSNEKEKTAYHLVGEYLKSQARHAKVFVVHRLDRDTSGVLIFAKNEQIKNKLQNDWNNIVYQRDYLAVVEGHLRQKNGTIKNYLNENKAQIVYIAKQGKLAISKYQVLKESRYNSLVKVSLETGRKNQIRVHLQSLGHSIVGDKKYGATTNPLKRMGLHCQNVGFVHPITKKKMVLNAPVPEEFNKLFK